jgi:hypothetical protein
VYTIGDRAALRSFPSKGVDTAEMRDQSIPILVEEALKMIGIDLSTVTPSQKDFLIKATQDLLKDHGLQWFKKHRILLQEQFDFLRNEL